MDFWGFEGRHRHELPGEGFKFMLVDRGMVPPSPPVEPPPVQPPPVEPPPVEPPPVEPPPVEPPPVEPPPVQPPPVQPPPVQPPPADDADAELKAYVDGVKEAREEQAEDLRGTAETIAEGANDELEGLDNLSGLDYDAVNTGVGSPDEVLPGARAFRGSLREKLDALKAKSNPTSDETLAIRDLDGRIRKVDKVIQRLERANQTVTRFTQGHSEHDVAARRLQRLSGQGGRQGGVERSSGREGSGGGEGDGTLRTQSAPAEPRTPFSLSLGGFGFGPGGGGGGGIGISSGGGGFGSEFGVGGFGGGGFGGGFGVGGYGGGSGFGFGMSIGSGDFIDVSGSGLQSGDARRKARKLEFMINLLLAAIAMGNVDMITSALTLCNLKAKTTLIGASLHMVRAMQLYDRNMRQISDKMGEIAGTQGPTVASQMQYLSAEMNQYSMARQAITNVTRDIMTMVEEIGNLEDSVYRKKDLEPQHYRWG